MGKNLFALPLILLLITIDGKGQGPLPVPLNIQRAISKGSRTNEGVPGKNYWQNGADYTIHVHFNPETRLVSGTESIVYFNHSPDTLKQLLFKVDANFYQKGAARAEAVSAADLTEGESISNVMLNQTAFPVKDIPQGTNWRVPISKLLPGDSMKVSLDFSYTLNMGSHSGRVPLTAMLFLSPIFSPGSPYMTISINGTCLLTMAHRNFIMISAIFQSILRFPKISWSGPQVI